MLKGIEMNEYLNLILKGEIKTFIKNQQTKKQFINVDNSLQKKAELVNKKIFLGGPLEDFENVGRLQLITLLKIGLYPHSKVLDVGCGCMRGGYWLINFLNPNCYFGIEPNKEMLEYGIRHFLSSELIEQKNPQFSNNSDFDFSVFNEQFDFIIARSIWTHAPKNKIKVMLDSFIKNSKTTGSFLTSYYKTGLLKFENKGENWIGRSHESDKPGIIFYNYSWIKKICSEKKLKVKELNFDVYNNQRWLYISKSDINKL